MGIAGRAWASARQSLVLRRRDPLTDLPLRASLLDAMRRELAAPQRGRLTGVLFVDLDGFKRVNDTLGHDGGDALLREVAARIAAAVGPRDLTARMGGDEFAVLLRGRQSIEDVMETAEAVLAAVATPLPLRLRGAGGEPGSSASIGAAVEAAEPGVDPLGPDDLLRAADLAMLAAKRRGGGHVQAYSPAVRRTVAAGGGLDDGVVAAMEHALTYETFDLRYQPVYCVRCGAAVRVEALLRVVGPDGTPHDPGRLLSAARASGRLDRVTTWVLARSMSDAVGWWSLGYEVPVSVNVSADELARPSAPGELLASLRLASLPPRALVVEVHRAGASSHAAALSAGLAGLAVAGVGVVLEDVDTTWPLGQVAAIAPDGISLSREGLGDAVSRPAAAVALDAILRVAGATCSTVTAKTLETPEQLATAVSLGATLVQGRLLGPVTTPQAFEWRAARLTMRDVTAPALTDDGPLATVHPCTTAFSYADRALAENQRPRDPSSPPGPGGFSRPRAHFDAAEES